MINIQKTCLMKKKLNITANIQKILELATQLNIDHTLLVKNKKKMEKIYKKIKKKFKILNHTQTLSTSEPNNEKNNIIFIFFL